MKLPEPFYFLRPAWWLVHLVAAGALLAGGFAAGEHLAGHGVHAVHDEPTHHDHSSAEALRPVMQQMLVDSVHLQGAVTAGDLPRAARHAEAIAGACEDGGSEQDVPAQFGPEFVQRDRDLHGSASRLAEALRAGRVEDARVLSRQMVSACESCHVQAPAASEVDLRVLTFYGAQQSGEKGEM